MSIAPIAFVEAGVALAGGAAPCHIEPMRALYVQDPVTGKIRLTRTAIERYGSRFARVGHDACKITTLEQFEAAVDASFALQMQELASELRGVDPELDAIMQGLPGWD